MISFIKGRVEDVDRDTLSIDVNGLGYRVFSSAATIGRVAPGEVVKLHTRMIVREDSISLFGFLGEDELYLFEKLITVSGIGPKVANCIMLFGVRDTAAFPVDTWVKQIMNDMYGFDLKDTKGMQAFAAEKYGDLAGYAQQYLFYYYRDRSHK